MGSNRTLNEKNILKHCVAGRKNEKFWLELMAKVALLELFAFVHVTVTYVPCTVYMCVLK